MVLVSILTVLLFTDISNGLVSNLKLETLANRYGKLVAVYKELIGLRHSDNTFVYGEFKVLK